MIICNDSDEVKKIRENLQDNFYDLRKSVKNIEYSINSLYSYSIDQEKHIRQQNPYIVKSVIKYMANGLNKNDAMLLTANDFKTDIKRVSAVFFGQGRYMAAINLFAKRYTCEKLKNAGYTAKQIANVIGVSENHVFKLLRATVDFWFLN